MPKLERVIETCLYVDDLDRAARFYGAVLGLARLTRDARFHAYDVGQRSVLLSSQKGVFVETPTPDTDVAEIVCRQFGVSRPTLYRYLGSKRVATTGQPIPQEAEA